MSFQAQDASPGSSTPTKQPSAKEPKRPTSLGRHSSSWVHRFHRHRDRKHHRSDGDVERPLLANDYLNEDEETQSPPALPSRPAHEPPRFLSATGHRMRKAYDTSRNFLVRNAKHVILAVLLALLTLFISICVGIFFHHKGRIKVSTCQSAACVHAASGILYNLDPDYEKLDACTQFDKMVCGGWEQRHDLRPDQGDMFTGTIMAENSKTILRHILEQSSLDSFSSPADQDNFKKLKDDYDSCMNERELQRIGLKPLLDLVNQIKLSFPMAMHRIGQNAFPTLETSTQHGVTFDGSNPLTNTLLYLMNSGISALLDHGVMADDRDPDTQVVMIMPPRRIGLPSKEYYENNELVEKYRAMSATVLQHFFEKSPGNTTVGKYRRSSMSLNKPQYQMAPQTEIEDLVREMVDFEVQLAAATPPTEDQDDVTKYYNPMTVAETHSLVPQVSFEYFIAQLAPEGYSPKKVIVASPAYMTALAKILSNSKKEMLQAFLVWKAIQHYEKKVEDPSLQPLRAFNNQLRGLDPSAKDERWRTCIDAVDQDLGWILSKFFVEAAFSETSKNFGDQIVTDIKNSFTITLDHAEWMTKAVRDRAIKKVHAIDQKIGYPISNPNILDPAALQAYYSTVIISNTTFFTNKLQSARFYTRQSWSKLGQPTRHDEWGMTVPTVNAYYNPAGNEIVFPAGIMQAPVFYDPTTVPQYLTYGAFGAVSGHELSHAFDSTGSHYDEKGNYTDWFDQATKEAFDNKTKCFEDQYSRFTIPGPNQGQLLHVNGKLTLGENIADAGGLHAAFSAWKRREAHKPSEALPGLHMFTPDQLFFISYGNWWCGKSTNEKAVERIYTDPHAPKWARILGTMDNSAAFKKAFKCKDVEPTCRLW